MNSGVYTITNKENGKVYIGSTIDFERRWKEHRDGLQKSTHGNPHLQASWNKYGEATFEFGVLEYLDNLDKLIGAEQFWMDIYREEGRELYNFGLAVYSPMRGRTHTEEARRKMGEGNKGRKLPPVSEETKRKISKAMTGKKRGPRSDETKRKIGNANRGRKLPSISKETRRRMSESGKKAWIKRRRCARGSI